MKKRIIFVLGVVMIIVFFIMFLYKKPSSMFTKDYYLGIVTIEGNKTSEVNFFDKSLENIGEIKLNGKDFLGIYNFNDVEQDENNFYFVKDSSAYSGSDGNKLLKVNKKDFKQTDINLSCPPSYFYVSKNNIYTIDVGRSENLSIFNKEKNASISEEKLEGELSPSIFEYNSSLYYYFNDKNKVTLYNYTNKKTELVIENVNEVLSTKIDGDNIY